MTLTQQRVYTLTFSGYPPGPNQRMHWMQRAKENKHWRELAGVTALAMGVPSFQRVRLSAVIVRRSVGRSDEDNDRARLKACVDGLVDVGVIPDDRRGCVEWGSVEEERGPKGLRIMIEGLA